MPRSRCSPTLYVYGYEIDQPAAVRYLFDKHPEWKEKYSYFRNHFAAMEFVSRELSQSCFVFYGKDIEEGNRSPHKFDEFEELLASTGISYTPIPKLEKLCSATYRKYPVAPPEMRRRPRPDDWERRVGHGIFPLLREVREADERCSREEGAVGQTGDHGAECVLRARCNHGHHDYDTC